MNTLSRTRRPLFQRSANGTRRILLLLLAVSVLLLTDVRSDRMDPLRDGLMQVVTPFLWLVEQPAEARRFLQFLRSHTTEHDAYRELQEQQLELLARMQRIEALEAENRRLRALLSSSEVLEARALVAEVMAASEDPYRQRLTLSRGSDDGVFAGQAVIDARGVLGQVVRVHHRTSIALLITDPDHGIPVEINRTGLQTIAVGSGDGQLLRLPFLPGNADLRVGDLLVSSSLGGRFPPGYPVARVKELRFDPGDTFMEALAVPEARINQSRQVLLLSRERMLDQNEPIDAPPAGADDGGETEGDSGDAAPEVAEP